MLRGNKNIDFCMFILLKSATSGGYKTALLSNNVNQTGVYAPFSGMRNSFLLLLVLIFTTRGHYRQSKLY